MPESHAAFVQALLDVERALAEAEADAGVIPASSVAPIAEAARLALYDVPALTDEAAHAGNFLIPLVRALTTKVAAVDPVAAGHVHLGATSQDIIDTALVLRLRVLTGQALEALDRAVDAAAVLARAHVATPMAGRTWMQQASPITFGLKAAVWLDGLATVRRRLAEALDAASCVQLGGATGTLAALGPKGPDVARRLAVRLGLRAPDLPWHTQRARLADLACAHGVACGTLGKVARDISLLSQTEVGEVREAHAPGRGGSSSMPHKRNPVRSAVALAAAVRAPGLVATVLAAMPQEHERALGGWQAEWDTLPTLAALAAEASAAIADALAGLEVAPDRMAINLDAEGGIARAEGLVTALTPTLGRAAALALVARVCQVAVDNGQSIEVAALVDAEVGAHLSPAAIHAALDPKGQLGASTSLVDAALRRARP